MTTTSISSAIGMRKGFIETLDAQKDAIARASTIIASVFMDGGKLMICGNGGSAADAQHMAAEFVGRFVEDRRGLPAIALTTDTSALTAIGNDWDYSYVFKRQLEALGNKGDVILCISASGASKNVLEAVRHAWAMDIATIGLVGRSNSLIGCSTMVTIDVGPGITPIVQERMLAVEHIICERVEEIMREAGAL